MSQTKTSAAEGRVSTDTGVQTGGGSSDCQLPFMKPGGIDGGSSGVDGAEEAPTEEFTVFKSFTSIQFLKVDLCRKPDERSGL